MQHIPHHNLEDIERSREEMAAFMNEKPVGANLTLTGEGIHNAFCKVDPDNACTWDEVPDIVKMKYDDLATELNARGGEDRPITAMRCPRCGEMFTNFKLKEHPCL
jgi:hypothetical protein